MLWLLAAGCELGLLGSAVGWARRLELYASSLGRMLTSKLRIHRVCLLPPRVMVALKETWACKADPILQAPCS